MTNSKTPRRRHRIPLYIQVIIGVFLGIVLGQLVRSQKLSFLSADRILVFGEIAKLVVDSIKALAVPLIFFAIIDGLIRTKLSLRHGWRLVGICLFNVSIAFTVGLVLINTIHPGKAWRSHLPEVESVESAAVVQASLSPIENFKKYIPVSVVDPFVKNSVISAVILAILIGAGLRHVLSQNFHEALSAKPSQQFTGEDECAASLTHHPVSICVNALYLAFMKMLDWLIKLVPIAVFGAVANVVAKYGLEAFQGLFIFLGFILMTLCVHALIYYTSVVWLLGRRTPAKFLREGADAIVTGLSTNSSLATVPVTLRCLTGGLGVSQQSARLSTCIGTNLNNDGIMLYEAMAVIFLAQAAGIEMDWIDQATILGASMMAGIGIAGIPEAGYVMLPLVLAVAGFSDEQIAVYWPLILPVDWILARVRSAVNVMGDMTVAIMLDRFESESQTL